MRPGRNVGFGAGVNRGLAALAGEPSPPEWVLVSNPDLVVHAGALAAMRQALASHPAWALVGPRIFTETGDVYPSVRCFPSFTDAAGHALLALFNPENPFTRRYNPGTPEGEVLTAAGWVSGSCFLARRSALEELGGFDEAYFMYNEDMDLCWRAHDAGWGVGFAGTAGVTHVQGVSTARHPYRMLAAHHRSALRFTVPDHEGLAAGRAAAGGGRAGSAPGDGDGPARARPLRQVAGRRGLMIVAIVAIAATVLVLVLAAAVSGPRHPMVHVEPQVTFALPPASTGCTGATALPGGATQVPLTVSTVAGQVAESLDVCIDGQGPFPFVLDSGAGQSTIDAGLAKRLHLPSAGPASQFAGVGCTGTALPVGVGSWSLDGVTLAPQQLTAATLPQIGGKGEPVGLIGSDVLSRFGAVRIDFTSDALGAPRARGTAAQRHDVVYGAVGPAADGAHPGGGNRRSP